MTVGELMRELSKHDPDTPVVFVEGEMQYVYAIHPVILSDGYGVRADFGNDIMKVVALQEKNEIGILWEDSDFDMIHPYSGFDPEAVDNAWFLSGRWSDL